MLQLDQLDPEVRGHVERATEDLIGEFRRVLSPETIQRYVDESRADLSGARFHDFVPLFIQAVAGARRAATATRESARTSSAGDKIAGCTRGPSKPPGCGSRRCRRRMSTR